LQLLKNRKKNTAKEQLCNLTKYGITIFYKKEHHSTLQDSAFMTIKLGYQNETLTICRKGNQNSILPKLQLPSKLQLCSSSG